MFDIRKIQEKIIYESVKAESDAEVADEVVFGKNPAENEENDCNWVTSAMQRLESKFELEDIKRIRMNCQCGYGMDEKLTDGSCNKYRGICKGRESERCGAFLQRW